MNIYWDHSNKSNTGATAAYKIDEVPPIVGFVLGEAQSWGTKSKICSTSYDKCYHEK